MEHTKAVKLVFSQAGEFLLESINIENIIPTLKIRDAISQDDYELMQALKTSKEKIIYLIKRQENCDKKCWESFFGCFG